VAVKHVVPLFQLILVVIGVVPPITASAADDAAVLAGYRKFYAADLDGARQDFEAVLARRQSDLPARFGLLTVFERRVGQNRAEAPQFERLLDAFIAAAEARYDRADSDSEALFYLANACMLRARYRLDYDKGLWGAARDGARSKVLSEAYIRRHPQHGDAYFALGAYNYYVELAPAFVKMLRLLMFLPSGNRAEGLRQLERAYTDGSLFGPQAGLLLIEIYGTYESRPDDGVRVGERLARDYPDNPRFQFTLAELYGSPSVEDPVKAAERFQAVVAREERRPGPPRDARFQAQLGLASSLLEQWRLSDAIVLLTSTIDARPESPAWVTPTFLLRRANYRALAGDQKSAKEDVARVLAEPKWKDRHKPATELDAWIDLQYAAGDGPVFAALVLPNRLTLERRWAEAAAAYELVRTRYPDHPHVRYRIAQMRFRKGEIEGLAQEFAAIAQARSAPAWLKAAALLQLGRVHDVAGRRADARKAYERVVSEYEGEGASWPARVGLITAYQRR
jgi:hypothetical protein